MAFYYSRSKIFEEQLENQLRRLNKIRNRSTEPTQAEEVDFLLKNSAGVESSEMVHSIKFKNLEDYPAVDKVEERAIDDLIQRFVENWAQDTVFRDYEENVFRVVDGAVNSIIVNRRAYKTSSGAIKMNKRRKKDVTVERIPIKLATTWGLRLKGSGKVIGVQALHAILNQAITLYVAEVTSKGEEVPVWTGGSLSDHGTSGLTARSFGYLTGRFANSVQIASMGQRKGETSVTARLIYDVYPYRVLGRGNFRGMPTAGDVIIHSFRKMVFDLLSSDSAARFKDVRVLDFTHKDA